jgi:hypothetical protein
MRSYEGDGGQRPASQMALLMPEAVPVFAILCGVDESHHR